MRCDNVVGVFWDLENLRPPKDTTCDYRGIAIGSSIHKVAEKFGVVKEIRAYADFSEDGTWKGKKLRNELASSGITLKDCAHDNRKDVADRFMIVDMMIFAMEYSDTSKVTIILIANDHGYVYAMNRLRQRKYRVVVMATSDASAGLRYEQEDFIDWDEAVLGDLRKNRPPKISCDTQFPAGSSFSTPTRGRGRSYTSSTNGGPPTTFLAGSHTAPVSPIGHGPYPTPNVSLSSSRENLNSAQHDLPISDPPVSDLVFSPPGLAQVTTNEILGVTEGAEIGGVLDTAPAIRTIEAVAKPHGTAKEVLRLILPSLAKPEVKVEPPTTPNSSAAPSPTEPSPDATLQPPPWTSLFVKSQVVGSLPSTSRSPLSASFPMTPTTTSTFPVPSKFEPLIRILEAYEDTQIKRSQVGTDLIKENPNIYHHLEYKGFKEYSSAAVDAGVVVLGGTGGDAWISLVTRWDRGDL